MGIRKNLETKLSPEDIEKARLERQRLESKLTDENIEKARRYETQRIEWPPTEEIVILGLSTGKYKGRPLSNSFLLHAKREADEFKALGYDFASPDLDTMSNDQRREVQKQRVQAFEKTKEPHLRALKEQYGYLTAVARENGYDLSPGTIMQFSLYHPLSELQRAIQWDPRLQPVPSEFEEAKEFALELLKGEPQYGKRLLVFFKNRKIEDEYSFEYPLYLRCLDQVKRIVGESN